MLEIRVDIFGLGRDDLKTMSVHMRFSMSRLLLVVANLYLVPFVQVFLFDPWLNKEVVT